MVLIEQGVVSENEESLLRHMDGEANVLVQGLGRRRKFFAEDIQQAIAPDKVDEVVAPALRYRCPGTRACYPCPGTYQVIATKQDLEIGGSRDEIAESASTRIQRVR